MIKMMIFAERCPKVAVVVLLGLQLTRAGRACPSDIQEVVGAVWNIIIEIPNNYVIAWIVS